MTQHQFCPARDWCWRVYAGRKKPAMMTNGQPALCGHEAGGTVDGCERVLARREANDG